MKKALIISLVIFLVSAVAFGISIPLTGVREGQGFGISISSIPFLGTGTSFGTPLKAGDVKEYTFNKSVNDISIITTSAETTIVADGEGNEITVKYQTETGGQCFNANVEGDKLVVKEDTGFIFSFFNFGHRESSLEITIPEKEYDNVEIITASGDIQIDSLICKDFDSVVTSGSSNYDIFADDISVTTTSGSVEVTNCTERPADKIKLDSVSGNHTISGFRCREFKLNSVSGTITAAGISGEGKADIVSGEIFIDYAEWNDDLKLDAVSGEIDITLPENSGVKVNLTALSGGVDVELSDNDGDTDESRISGDTESGRLGGDNVHEVKVDLVSGDVSIHN